MPPHVRRAVLAVILAICLLLPACGPFGTASRPPDGERWVLTTLYFGLSRPGGEVTPEEWRRFVDEVVTPRFKDGLTVFEASGQWLDQRGIVVKEKTRVLVLLHPPGLKADELIDFIRARYKTLFQQESVLRTDQEVRVSF